MAKIFLSDINFWRGADCPRALVVIQTAPDVFVCAYRDDGPDLCGIRDRASRDAAAAWIDQAERAGLTIERHVQVSDETIMARLPARMPRQASVAGTGPDMAGMLRKRASAPLKPRKPQAPCDVGLFSDEAEQLDMCEMFQNPAED